MYELGRGGRGSKRWSYTLAMSSAIVESSALILTTWVSLTCAEISAHGEFYFFFSRLYHKLMITTIRTHQLFYLHMFGSLSYMYAFQPKPKEGSFLYIQKQETIMLTLCAVQGSETNVFLSSFFAGPSVTFKIPALLQNGLICATKAELSARRSRRPRLLI